MVEDDEQAEEAAARFKADIAEYVENLANHRSPTDEANTMTAAEERAAIVDWMRENETAVIERAIDRMGWPEIHAFQERLQQDVYEDAGGFMLRKFKRLFGIKRDTITSYQQAARAALTGKERPCD